MHEWMNDFQFKNTFFRKLGYGVWGVMLVMSLVFYKERAFFMDAGFLLFNLINEGVPQVYHYRFIMAIPQVLPFLLLKIGAPLWMLGMAFSAAYILFYLLVYHLLVRHLRNDLLGWVLIFLFTLIALDTFYHIQSEFYLGLTLLLLSFGIVLRYPDLKGKWIWLLLAALLFAVGFSHKLSLIFFLFLWLFFWLHLPALRHIRYGLFLFLFGAIAALKSVFFTNWYEAAKQVDFQHHWEQYFPDFLAIPANMVFLHRSIDHYYMLPLLLGVISVGYIWQKQWLKLGMVWSFSLGFLLLYNISDPDALYRFYSEVTYLPLSIFIAVPFFFDLVNGWERKGPQKLGGSLGIFLLCLMALRLSVISLNHRTFDRLYEWILVKLDQPSGNKFLLKQADVPMDTVLMEWGVAFTSMHLSALQGATHTKTLFILSDSQRFERELTSDSYFLSPFKAIELKDLNEKYFDLGKGKYQEIE